MDASGRPSGRLVRCCPGVAPGSGRSSAPEWTAHAVRCACWMSTARRRVIGPHRLLGATGPVEPRMISRVSRRIRSLVAGRVVDRWPASSAHRALALLADRLVHRGERRVRVLADVDVVEADDGQVLGHPQPELARGAQHADRHRVRHGEDAGRAGGRPPRRRRRRRCRPRCVAGATTNACSGSSMPAASNAADVAAHPARRRRPRSPCRAPGVGGSIADDEEVAMAERRSGARRPARAPPSSSISTVGWSGIALESTITSGRPAARICSTSGWRADRPIATTPSTVARPIARASEPWSGRDEVERVALLLGRQRDALRERPEERVGEDHRQRLRREHAEGVRLALGEHPGDRVRAGSRGSRRPSRIRLAVSGASRLGAVEGERHRGLRDARLAGDVGDARTAPGPLLHGHLGCSDPDRRAGDGLVGSPDQPVIAACRRLIAPSNRFSKPV